MENLPLPSPLTTLLAATIAIGVFLYLVVALKIELWHLQSKLRTEYDSLRRTCLALQERIDEMAETVRIAEERATVLVPPQSSRSGMNMNKRIQAARMSKRGERPEQIAAALGLPKNEVALLLKVQRSTLPN